jgi:hypothetical protein
MTRHAYRRPPGVSPIQAQRRLNEGSNTRDVADPKASSGLPM